MKKRGSLSVPDVQVEAVFGYFTKIREAVVFLVASLSVLGGVPKKKQKSTHHLQHLVVSHKQRHLLCAGPRLDGLGRLPPQVVDRGIAKGHPEKAPHFLRRIVHRLVENLSLHSTRLGLERGENWSGGDGWRDGGREGQKQTLSLHFLRIRGEKGAGSLNWGY